MFYSSELGHVSILKMSDRRENSLGYRVILKNSDAMSIIDTEL